MSSYKELIKNFEKTRAYIRDFYVYGFKSRDGYDRKSLRSYDDERRRTESWLGDYMGFVRTNEGKNVFLAVDSRSVAANPFYKAWKSKSFTDGDITLHFLLFDILSAPDIALSTDEILRIMDGEYLSKFKEPLMFDESTVRKKLKEYCAEGIVECEKRGRKVLYRRAENIKLPENNGWLEFFSEVLPLGVIGSFLLDKLNKKESPVHFKHHYLTSALDSEILRNLFEAMHRKSEITVVNHTRGEGTAREFRVVPLRVFISVQSGRQYLMAYYPGIKGIRALRVDYLSDIKIVKEYPGYESLRSKLDDMQKHIWGTQIRADNTLQHVDFTVKVSEDEDYIISRLEREKRCGTVTKLDDSTYKFSADVYDVNELLTWIRTFICRITEIHFSDKQVEKRFRCDLEEMYGMYGIEKEGEV